MFSLHTFPFHEVELLIPLQLHVNSKQLTGLVLLFFERATYCYQNDENWDAFFYIGWKLLVNPTKLCTCELNNNLASWACEDCKGPWTCGCNGGKEVPCELSVCHWSRWQYSCEKHEEEAIPAKPETDEAAKPETGKLLYFRERKGRDPALASNKFSFSWIKIW